MGEITYTDFPFKTTPFHHQFEAWKFSKDLEAYALFMDLGTGKSKVVLDTAGYLFLTKKIEGQVIVAPKGMVRAWVEEQIPTHLTDAIQHRTAYWSSSARKEEKESLQRLDEPGAFLRTLVVNVEAASSERAMKEVFAFLKKYRCLMTVDESTTIRNPSAKRTKLIINLGKHAAYRRICSGNCIPNGAVNLWSQTEFLQKNLLGFANYFAFRNRFAVIEDKRFGNKSFKVVVGYRDLDVLKKMMSKFAFVIRKEDCLDLPEKIYQVIDVELSKEQKEAYNKMLEDAFIQLSTGQVSAQLVITQLLRLHQITCGFMAPDHMEPIPFEQNDRLNTLIELLEQCTGKAIIWATYRFSIKQIYSELCKKFGTNSTVHFYGDTTSDERVEATRKFQNDPSVRWMVANPATGRFGQTWTAASTEIFYANSYDLEFREQSEDRAHRIGQTRSVIIIDLRCIGTVDEKILQVLKKKKKLTSEIMQSNWKWILGGRAT